MYPGRQRFFGSFLMPDIGSLSDVDILFKGPQFEITLKFSTENTLIHEKGGKYYHRTQKVTFYFPDVYN